MGLEKRITEMEHYVRDVPELHTTERTTNSDDQIATGLMRGMQMLREDDERTMKLMELSRKAKRLPSHGPMSSSDSKLQPFDTGGDLIPSNLTKNEQEVLKMFYEKE